MRQPRLPATTPRVQYRALGASGLKVSVVGLGSWLTFGNQVGTADCERLVHAAFERGVNLFDTADVYASGEGERALGAAIAALPRHRLVIATKCFFPMSDDANDRGLSRKHVHESLRASLRRLGTDYVDLYQCHRFDAETPLLETARAMHDLIVQGHALYWGTSQWPAERITEVVALCREQRLHAPIANQPLYNLFDRGIERDVIPASARAGLGQLVYSPLAQGVLTGKYAPGRAAPATSRAEDERSNQFIARYLTPERLQQAQQLAAIAARAGATPVQVALAFCLRQANVATVLVGARNEQQLTANLAAAGVTLPAAVLDELERVFPA
jgi:voltage-dependent potassium channel beta subunit